jgi:hypothetical protein
VAYLPEAEQGACAFLISPHAILKTFKCFPMIDEIEGNEDDNE